MAAMPLNKKSRVKYCLSIGTLLNLIMNKLKFIGTIMHLRVTISWAQEWRSNEDLGTYENKLLLHFTQCSSHSSTRAKGQCQRSVLPKLFVELR